jgi:hypothetical protein
MMWKASRSLLVCLIVFLLALVLAMYGAGVSPADSRQPRPTPTSLSASRFFVLLPDGRVEISDAVSRRVFRWDGHRWLETDSLSRAQSDSQ